MGTGIKTQIQVLKGGDWTNFYEPIFTRYGEASCSPFSQQNYGLFAFLADVRNYACIPVLDMPRGLPVVEEPDFDEGIEGLSIPGEWDPWPEHRDNHSATWFLVSELISYDYDAQFENRRDGGDSVSEGAGEITTIRNYIGQKYFEDLAILRNIDDPTKVRVIISFDS